MQNKVALIGIPYDENSSFCKGPAKAPNIIKQTLLTGSLNKGCENGQLIDVGKNVELLPDITVANPNFFFETIEQQVCQYLEQGYRLVTLGGDHSISYPIINAYNKFYPDLTIIHIDAHSDLYHEFKGNLYSNASPFARIMENKLATGLHQFGIRTLTEHQRKQANKFNVHVNEMKDWPNKLPNLDGPLYISIDIDAIDPAFAPGVSHREPGGLSSRELINIIHQVSGIVVGIDIVEFNPDKDIDNLTANLAAKLVKETLGKLLAHINS